MRTPHIVLPGILLLAHYAFAQGSDVTPLAVVNKRMKALNDHEFELFMSTYAEDVAIYVYPDKLLGKGKAHIRRLFAPMMERGDVRVTVHHQLAADGYVVNETTTSFASRAETGISIYEVRNGLIHTVRFVRDNIRAAQVQID